MHDNRDEYRGQIVTVYKFVTQCDVPHAVSPHPYELKGDI